MQAWWEAVKQALQAAREDYVSPQKSQMGSRNNFFSSLPNCIGSLICGAVLSWFFSFEFPSLAYCSHVQGDSQPLVWSHHQCLCFVLHRCGALQKEFKCEQISVSLNPHL